MKETAVCGYSRKAVALAACLGCAFFGITMFFWGAMLPTLNGVIEGVESLPWILTVGIVLGTIACGIVVDRYGYKWLMICSAFALALGLCGFNSMKSTAVIYISTLLIGAGGGVLNSETIAVISDIYDDAKRGTMLSLLGGMYCVGSLLWTVACRFFVSDYSVPVMWSAALIAVYCIVFCFVKFPAAKMKKGESLSFGQSVGLLKYNLLAVVAFLLFFEGMVEAVSSNYTTTYLTLSGSEDKVLTAAVAVTALIFMTVGMMAGRFTLPLCLKSGGPAFSFYLFMVIALVGSLLLCVHGSAIAACVTMTALGFGMGVTAPVIFSYLGQVFKKYSGTAVSIVVIVAQLGMIAGNFIAGKMFSDASLVAGINNAFPYLVAALFAVMMIIFRFVAISTVKTKNKKLDL